MTHRYCPYCTESVLRYDISASVFYCLDCEHVEAAAVGKYVVPRGTRGRARIKTTRLPSRRTLGRATI